MIPAKEVRSSPLLSRLAASGDLRIVQRDADGKYRFAEGLINADRCREALLALKAESHPDLGEAEIAQVLEIYERVFQHRAFTGRSGTMFAYEGLGSIYWHMVGKLLVAAQECYVAAVDAGAPAAVQKRLADRYHEIRSGVAGLGKSPAVYGAFPLDPYSHTPAHAGAQQPGMTGEVKEEILTRMGELGARVREGRLQFRPLLLRKGEFLRSKAVFEAIDVGGERCLDRPSPGNARLHLLPGPGGLPPGRRARASSGPGPTERWPPWPGTRSTGTARPPSSSGPAPSGGSTSTRPPAADAHDAPGLDTLHGIASLFGQRTKFPNRP